MLSEKRYRTAPLSLLCAFLVLVTAGCSIKKLAVNSVANALSGEGGLVFTGEDDPELVGDALPFALKMYESLIEQVPDNRALLVATGKAFAMYAFAYVAEPATRLPDEQLAEKKRMLKRAKNLSLRGRDYIFGALELSYPGFTETLKKHSADSALTRTVAADTTALYWLGMAWMAAITTDKFDLGLLFGLKKAVACIEKVMELNPTYAEGACHDFFVSYYGGLPASMGGSEQKAREYFDKAIELSGGRKAGPYLALATTVGIKNQNVAEFKELLEKALAIDTSEKNQNRLTNVIYQEKARWLLENMDRYFFLDEPEETDE
jgi:predicted anti-sigma-YlaC factor YlaD